MDNQKSVVEKLFKEHNISYIPVSRVVQLKQGQDEVILFLASGGVLCLPQCKQHKN